VRSSDQQAKGNGRGLPDSDVVYLVFDTVALAMGFAKERM